MLARTAHSYYTDGRHTENKHAGIAHRKHAHTDGTLYKTRTESIETLMDRWHTENMHEGTYGRHIYKIQTEDAHKIRTRGRHTENLHARTAYNYTTH